MSDNPLESSPKRDAAIEARAKQLWEAAGNPNASLDGFRERADELIRMEGAGVPGQLPIDTGPIIEEAAIQENLGEFPGRQADQGDRLQTPMTREDLQETANE